MRELHLLLGNAPAGVVVQKVRSGHLELVYDEAWRQGARSYPLSTSMPLARRVHDDAMVRPFLMGLLPDDPEVRRRWGRRFGVSGNNPFALLEHVGEDCPGACRFVPPHRVPEILSDRGSIRWLTPQEMQIRIRRMEEDRSAWLDPDGPGYFSLAGAQAKFAVVRDGDRWGIPSGARATTHIVKPAIPGLPGILENEVRMLAKARELGLPAVDAEIVTWGAAAALVVTRYDRAPGAHGQVARVHQEDLCQALGVPPDRKYQAEGGPSPRDVAARLRDVSARPMADLRTFVDALIFSWVTLSTDGHAKNFSLLIHPEGRVGLAPLYDLASMAPYPQVAHRRALKMAMAIGGEYRAFQIGDRHWRRLADEVGLDPDEVLERTRTLRAQLDGWSPV